MPKPLGALWSLRATGVIGGHRRVPSKEAAEVPFIHPVITSFIPGVPPVGIQKQKFKYVGDTWTTIRFVVQLGTVHQGQDMLMLLLKNFAGFTGHVLPAGDEWGWTDVHLPVYDRDDFQLVITQVGIPPNEGQDLTWSLVGGL